MFTAGFEEKLLYSTYSGKIKELNIINGDVRELGNAESEVFVLAYDNEEKYVYVPRQTQRQIIRFPYPSNQTTEFEIVVSEIIPGGIAFDSEHRYLYWTEPMEGKIMRCNTDGSNITRIFNDTVEPAALTIDKGHRWMYFGQGIPNGTIHKLSLDGEGHHIINDLASWVFGIYADDTRLYWMDNFMGDLKSALFDGTDIQTIVSTNTFKLNGEIDVKEEFIFYTSNTERVYGLLLFKQEGQPPLSFEGSMRYSFDYAQHIHYPHYAHQVGPLFCKTPRKCQCFGVCAEGPDHRYFTSLMKVKKLERVPIVILTCYTTILNISHMRKQQSNFTWTTVQCRTRITLYGMWRVLTGRHNSVEFSCTEAGHTKFHPDWHFGLWMVKWRHYSAKSITASSRKHHNIAQLVDDEGCPVKFCDWKLYL
ncbi:Hypothetical predicted protein [Mytilus galloprovincialis]|uniref:Prolow-density lipoprotein receptor-related protein 1-like beta-propeller domain-containing protein n=1 Tax=Mytilus galloprovincialis TaxID=29158 RepID=A0A8B6G0K9_MYTGA|nr:Hypothetical predicted protein [Mytilus galloprovincialis]